MGLARRAGELGGTLPAVLNAANEVAVEAFCKGNLRFDQISQAVAQVMERHQRTDHPTLDQILAADQWARGETAGLAW
jgi:1-deoxy-D-xylulose-5-phosphate reductoisomerase